MDSQQNSRRLSMIYSQSLLNYKNEERKKEEREGQGGTGGREGKDTSLMKPISL